MVGWASYQPPECNTTSLDWCVEARSVNHVRESYGRDNIICTVDMYYGEPADIYRLKMIEQLSSGKGQNPRRTPYKECSVKKEPKSNAQQRGASGGP